MKLVAWKKAAQALETGAELVSRDTSDVGAPGALARLDRVRRRSPRRSACRASPRGRSPPTAPAADYGLRLPGLEIAPGGGEAQRRRCLEALALWQA